MGMQGLIPSDPPKTRSNPPPAFHVGPGDGETDGPDAPCPFVQTVEDLMAVGRELNPELKNFDASCFDGVYCTGGRWEISGSASLMTLGDTEDIIGLAMTSPP